MTDEVVVQTLADEFSIETDVAQRVLSMLSAGLKVPVIARYRRREIGALTEGTLRRFVRRVHQLEELGKRRDSLLRSIEEQRKALGTPGDGEPSTDAPQDEASGTEAASAVEGEPRVEALRRCTDRFELEDLFLPHRRPEPEVQLAIDRGLEPLARLLTAPAPKARADDETPAAAEPAQPTETAEAQGASDAAPPAPEARDAATDGPAASGEDTPGEASSEAREPAAAAPSTVSAAEPAEGGPAGTPEGAPAEADETPAGSPTPGPAGAAGEEPPVHGLHIELTPALARICAEFVNPDRGIHSDQEALEGAVRILSDRLGRNPSLRASLRRALRKNGRLRVRALVPEKSLGRHKALLKVDTPIRQLQGHRLLELRQAQAQRHVATAISVDESLVLPKVRNALGKRLKPEFRELAAAVAEQALRQRLLPMIEDDVRTELRERADEEALRFLSQHLRQILLTPFLGDRPVAGVHVDAKGDWWIAVLDAHGQPQGEPVRLEAGAALPRDLATPLAEALRAHGVRALAAGHGKAVRAGVHKLRETIELIQADAAVYLVNEAGLSNYVNSEAARQELEGTSVPARQAISLGRRLQDPLGEFLKVDPRHLGLGREQSIVSKANLRRVLHDTLESSVALVGCDLNRAPLTFLRHVPGLNFELAKKLVERRAERPFSSREELRTEGLLDDTTWTNAIGFLRVSSSSEPLDATALHPEQYDLVRRVIHDAGQSVEEALGQNGALRGLKAKDYELDEYTWRDIQREVSHPGRDPRFRLFFPRLLPADTDVKTLEKAQVVEGIVSSVTSFGAFVDLGVVRDGMIHISEISSRYVRDARALLSIGQLVRARVLDASGPRVELSLKNVPDPRRKAGGGKRTGGGAGGAGGGRRQRTGERGKGEPWPEYAPVRRAASSRRDGLVTGGGKEGRGGGRGRGGKAGAGRGKPRGGPGRGRGDRGGRDEHYDPAAVREASRDTGAYNPFANFFKGREAKEG